MNLESFLGGVVPMGLVGTAGVLVVIVMLWSLVWKGMSLWKAAREGSKIWFVVLLVVNTVGILDILYIHVFSKMSKKSVEAPKV